MKKVVVGYDGTDESKDALQLGRLITGATGAKLYVACVNEQAKEIERLFEEAARELSDHQFERYTATGSAAEGISATVHGIGAELVVVGSGHQGKAGRVYPGSVGERLLSGTGCAVAVAPRGYVGRSETASAVIGVGYDGRSESKEALTFASELAQAMGASLKLIAVVPNVFEEHHVGYDAAQLRALREMFTERVDEAVAGLPKGVNATKVIEEGEPAEVLARCAEDVDLMVVGSRAYGPIRYSLLGGVSHPLMRSAPSPLMVVPKGSSTEPSGHAVAEPVSG